MSTNVQINIPLVGPTHFLNEADIANWDDVILQIEETPCFFEIFYNGDNFPGQISRSADRLTLNVAFVDEEIALPSGMCMFVNCFVDPPGENGCFPNQVVDIDEDTRLMVVDENGCGIGWTSLADIVALIQQQLNIPQTLCDLIGPDGIPEGNLVAGDRIVTTTNGCDLKSVPQDQVVCD